MLFSRLIRRLASFPESFALGFLWLAEITTYVCALAGSYLLSRFLFDNIRPDLENLLFSLALLTYLLAFYLVYFIYVRVSLLIEGLAVISRLGGPEKAERAYFLEKKKREEGTGGEDEPMLNPFDAPERVRASAEGFKRRYFILLPTVLVLYLVSFTSTIYRIFARQILTWEPGYLVLPALGTVVLVAACFWFLMPCLSGNVSMLKLLGYREPEGD